MDISKLKIFNLMQTNMSYLGAKQDVMAQNISNSNTPGYDVKEMKPLDFKAILSGSSTSKVTIASTSPVHFLGGSGASGATEFDVGEQRNPFEITPTGNKVVLEQEMMKLNKNNMEYQQTTNIYRKMLQMMKMALGENV
jgi:flagellar basal-body rod protein FlgB